MLVKQNTATHVPIYIVQDDHLTPQTGLVGTDFTVHQISKNAAAFGALTVTITERAYGWYDLTLASGDCDTLGVIVLHFEAVGIDPIDIRDLQVVAIDFTLATFTLTDGSVTAAKFAAGAIDAAAIADGAIDAATFAAGAINAAAIAADAITAAKVADGAIDAATFAASAITAAAIASDAITAAKIATGAITSAKFAAGAIDAAAIATDAIDADALKADAVTEIQSGLATSVALATVQADTDNIQTRLPAALIMGRMDSTAIVTEVGSGAIAEASFQDGAITAAKVEADTYQAIAGYVWEEDATTHTNPDTFGKYVADLWNAFGGTTLGDILDGINNVPSGVWAFAHESGRTAKGVMVRLDALMTGKATGLLGVLATFFRSDGTTKAIEATQDPTLGTRSQASTIGGD